MLSVVKGMEPRHQLEAMLGRPSMRGRVTSALPRNRAYVRCRGKRLSTARAARSISAVRVRREGREWVPAYLMLTGSGSESLTC